MSFEVFVSRRNSLQGIDRISDNKPIDIVFLVKRWWNCVDNEIPHAKLIQLGDISVTVIAISGNGENNVPAALASERESVREEKKSLCRVARRECRARRQFHLWIIALIGEGKGVITF